MTQSSVLGLFAAGEAAAGHGANRLGENSLSDLLVFGRRAGLAAAENAKRSPMPTIYSLQIADAERQMLYHSNAEVAKAPTPSVMSYKTLCSVSLASFALGRPA